MKRISPHRCFLFGIHLMKIHVSQAFCFLRESSLFSGCATGSCNIFCCNCDGECRVCSSFSKRQQTHSENQFNEMDKDGDGAITKLESLDYLYQHGPNTTTTLEQDSKWFTDMDKNRDGLID